MDFDRTINLYIYAYCCGIRNERLLSRYILERTTILIALYLCKLHTIKNVILLEWSARLGIELFGMTMTGYHCMKPSLS